MHVPDGFLDLPTSLTTGALALTAGGLALSRARTELDEAGPARAALTGTFIFAAQMVNFPVAAGTSGHLIGAALAAALVGPWTAVLVMSLVVAVQALFFADGGLTALGTNVLLLAVVPVALSWLVMRLGVRLTRGRERAVVPIAAVAAFLSVPVAALAFVGLYLLGGAVAVPLPMLAGAMLGVHLLIGIGEALITAAVLGAVLSGRPDLVRLASLAELERARLAAVPPVPTHAAPPALPPANATGLPHAPSPRRPVGKFAFWALAVTAAVAGGLSLFAATTPDGLESVAGALGFESAATDSPLATAPLADYTLTALGTAGSVLAGLFGAAVTLLLVLGVARLARKGRA